MSDRKRDVTSLGEILVAMGVCTRDDLYDVLVQSTCINSCGLFGQLLQQEGVATKEQVAIAMAAQAGLRSDSKNQRALATADIAHARKDCRKKLSMQLVEKGRIVVTRITSEDHAVVALAEDSS